MIDSPYDSSAPYNQRDPEPATERKKVYISISKEMDLDTFDTELDEDEGHDIVVARKDADWVQAYNDDELNLSKLLKILGTVAGCRIKELERDCKNLSVPLTARRQKYKKLLHWQRISKACKDWEVDDIIVE